MQAEAGAGDAAVGEAAEQLLAARLGEGEPQRALVVIGGEQAAGGDALEGAGDRQGAGGGVDVGEALGAGGGVADERAGLERERWLRQDHGAEVAALGIAGEQGLQLAGGALLQRHVEHVLAFDLHADPRTLAVEQAAGSSGEVGGALGAEHELGELGEGRRGRDVRAGGGEQVRGGGDEDAGVDLGAELVRRGQARVGRGDGGVATADSRGLAGLLLLATCGAEAGEGEGEGEGEGGGAGHEGGGNGTKAGAWVHARTHRFRGLSATWCVRGMMHAASVLPGADACPILRAP